MRQSEIREFYQKWIQQVSTLTVQDGSRYSFDKFIYLYIIYNALYCRATTCLKYYEITQNKKKEIDHNEGRVSQFQAKIISFDPDEKTQAVNNVVKFFDGNNSQQCGENLIDFLRAGNNANIELIRDFDNEFYIYSLRKYGLEKARKSDLKLKDKLVSQSPKEQAEGILELIYHVRCNLFHGEKRFNPRQEDFLKPIVRILQSIVQELYARLNNPENPYYMDDKGYETYLEEWQKQLKSRDEYESLLKSLKKAPTDLATQQKIHTIGKLLGYAPSKIDNDISKKQPKNISRQ